jgi:cupin fold WbuC family metalloprotein
MKKINKGEALYHCVFSLSDLQEDRIDITPAEEYLQCACIKMDKGKSFQPHVHIKCERHTDLTQEAWVVFAGSVKVDYYDEDCNFMDSVTLKAGDCTISFRGGHKYECVEDGTLVYEFKSGPYFGRTADKVTFDD